MALSGFRLFVFVDAVQDLEAVVHIGQTQTQWAELRTGYQSIPISHGR